MKEIYKHYYENLSNKFTITENTYVKKRPSTEYRIPENRFFGFDIDFDEYYGGLIILPNFILI
jgi:hypothetical protein